MLCALHSLSAFIGRSVLCVQQKPSSSLLKPAIGPISYMISGASWYVACHSFVAVPISLDHSLVAVNLIARNSLDVDMALVTLRLSLNDSVVTTEWISLGGFFTIVS
jgi:hypothetical protein